MAVVIKSGAKKNSKSGEKGAAKVMKPASKGQGEIKKQKRHVFTNEERALIKEYVDDGYGYRKLRQKFATGRSNGRKPWSVSGRKKLVQSIKAGRVQRETGQGRTRNVRTDDVVGEIREWVTSNPGAKIHLSPSCTRNSSSVAGRLGAP